MIGNFLRWILHWFGQGMKLWLFGAMASICTIPAYLPLALLEDIAPDFEELGVFGKIGIISAVFFLSATSIAIFTAVLASQLRDHPLRPFVPSKARKSIPQKSLKPEKQS